MTKNIKNFLLVLFIILLFLEKLIAMDGLENSSRNWRTSLNLYNSPETLVEKKDENSEFILSEDAWVLDTGRYINSENVTSILSLNGVKDQAYENNICAGRFTISYFVEKDGAKKKKYVSWDLNKIFISGRILIKDQKLKEYVISAMSFFGQPLDRNVKVAEAQRGRINKLLGKTVVRSGTCAEVSMVLYINDSLPVLMKAIQDHEKESKVEIIGTILEISSLKDPCSNNCMPMLSNFMEKMQGILLSNILDHISVAQTLENITLISGKSHHMKSREGLLESSEKIILDFQKPMNRIFSKKI
jgi:hypothetical protein